MTRTLTITSDDGTPREVRVEVSRGFDDMTRRTETFIDRISGPEPSRYEMGQIEELVG